jgi:hypothetical protein
MEEGDWTTQNGAQTRHTFEIIGLVGFYCLLVLASSLNSMVLLLRSDAPLVSMSLALVASLSYSISIRDFSLLSCAKTETTVPLCPHSKIHGDDRRREVESLSKS